MTHHVNSTSLLATAGVDRSPDTAKIHTGAVPGTLAFAFAVRFCAVSLFAGGLAVAGLSVVGMTSTSAWAVEIAAPKTHRHTPSHSSPALLPIQIEPDLEGEPDADELLETPVDDAEKVFTTDREIELRNEDIDTLFELLEASATKEEADEVVGELQRRFHQSGSPTVDLLLGRAVLAARTGKSGPALDLLDAITRLKPDFAEGWNKRSAVHIMTQNFDSALADLEQTLLVEPRHFIALTRLANLLQRYDRDEDALRIYERVLIINPHDEDVRKDYDELKSKLDGRGA